MTTTKLPQNIPLNKLAEWEGNVRKTQVKGDIAELAASIKAYGLIQNLSVIPDGKKFAVIAGNRRRARRRRRNLRKLMADMPALGGRSAAVGGRERGASGESNELNSQVSKDFGEVFLIPCGGEALGFHAVFSGRLSQRVESGAFDGGEISRGVFLADASTAEAELRHRTSDAMFY